MPHSATGMNSRQRFDIHPAKREYLMLLSVQVRAANQSRALGGSHGRYVYRPDAGDDGQRGQVRPRQLHGGSRRLCGVAVAQALGAKR